MPGVETNAEPVDVADEATLQVFADQVRDAVSRLQDDAAIALELNPESPALDDVHLVRDLIVAYAERIMELEGIVRGVGAICLDEVAWPDCPATRRKILDTLGPLPD